MQKVFDTKNGLKFSCGSGEAMWLWKPTIFRKSVADVIWIRVAGPYFAHSSYAQKLTEVRKPGQIVLVLPGTFGSLIFWKEFKKKNIQDVVVAEAHTLPYATRLTGPGQSLIMSRMNPLKICAYAI